MSQASNSSGIRDTEQLSVQQKLDQLFRLLLLVSLPAALAAAARAIEFGFHAGAILQLACYVFLGLALLAGPRLGFRLRINIYTGLMVAFGGLGLYNYGLFGQGLMKILQHDSDLIADKTGPRIAKEDDMGAAAVTVSRPVR